MPLNVEPRFVGFAVAAVLVLALEFSLMSAGIVGMFSYLIADASRRQGGVRRAVVSLTAQLANTIGRATGTNITNAQAGFLLVASALLVWRALGGSLWQK